jgi:hypothetical protein
MQVFLVGLRRLNCRRGEQSHEQNSDLVTSINDFSGLHENFQKFFDRGKNASDSRAR